MLNLTDVTFNNAQLAPKNQLFTLSLPERCQFATELMVVVLLLLNMNTKYLLFSSSSERRVRMISQKHKNRFRIIFVTSILPT